jgi:hypothetical protein
MFLTCALANADAQAEQAFRSGVAAVNNNWYKLMTAVWPNVLTISLAAWLAIDSFKQALSERAARWDRWDQDWRRHGKMNLLGNLRRLFLELVLVIGAGLTVLVVQCVTERAGLLADWGAAYGFTVSYDVSSSSRWGSLVQDRGNRFAGAAYFASPWVVMYELQDPCGKLGRAVVYGAVATTAFLWLSAILYLNWQQQSDLFQSLSQERRHPTTWSTSPVLWVLRSRQRWRVLGQPSRDITAENFDPVLVDKCWKLHVGPVIDEQLRISLMAAEDGVFNRFKTREELDNAGSELRKEMAAVLRGVKIPTDDALLRVRCNFLESRDWEAYWQERHNRIHSRRVRLYSDGYEYYAAAGDV